MNVLLITSEQQHYRTLGHSAVPRTPALDRLAAGGLAFDRAYCTSPTCAPSRATILTGWYPAWQVTADMPTISGLLSHLGYATSLIGRAHIGPAGQTSAKALLDLDFWRRWTGPYRGFDHAELSWGHAGEADIGQHYALWLEERAPDWRRYFRREPPDGHTMDLPAELHHGTWVAERAIAAIEAAVLGDRPFFCWASFHDPQPPYLAPEPFASMYDPADLNGILAPRKDIAVYYGMITALDQQIGRILRRLEALEVAGETLVVFTSDHGHPLGGSTELVPREDLLRVPLVVRWPGRVPPGTRTSALHAHVDLAPTLLHALEIAEPGPMQGESQLPVWLGESDRVRDHLIVEHHDPAVQLRSYIEDRYKITIYRGRDRGELIDLAEDPEERHNRFPDPAYAEVKTALLHRFLDAELHREPR
jgi:arylsulfatase A-like enzyme